MRKFDLELSLGLIETAFLTSELEITNGDIHLVRTISLPKLRKYMATNFN